MIAPPSLSFTAYLLLQNLYPTLTPKYFPNNVGAMIPPLPLPSWSVKTRRAPSRHDRDARVCGHTPTAMHDMSHEYPPLICRLFRLVLAGDRNDWESARGFDSLGGGVVLAGHEGDDYCQPLESGERGGSVGCWPRCRRCRQDDVASGMAAAADMVCVKKRSWQ